MKVRVWDVASDAEPRRLEGHQAALSSIGFGDRTLVSTGTDTTALVWDAALLRDLKSFATKLTPGELESLCATWAAGRQRGTLRSRSSQHRPTRCRCCVIGS
jgi:WD40 repeat protein